MGYEKVYKRLAIRIFSVIVHYNTSSLGGQKGQGDTKCPSQAYILTTLSAW